MRWLRVGGPRFVPVTKFISVNGVCYIVINLLEIAWDSVTGIF